MISGLPGTGKTTLAVGLGQRIAARPWPCPGTKPGRRSAAGPPAVPDRGFTRLSGRYPRDLQEQANRRLEGPVTGVLAAGRSVIAEVVADHVIRRPLHELARRHEALACSIEETCSDPAELARRLSGRPGQWNRIAARMSKSYQPSATALVVDSCTTRSEMVDQAMRYICQET